MNTMETSIQTAHVLTNVTVTRTNDVYTCDGVTFATLLIPDHILQGLSSAGFYQPSPIQLKAIPLGRCGFDIVIQAKSGTGKTCVFVVVALELVDTTRMSVQVVVLVPTREIAIQTQEVFKTIGCSIPELKCHVFIGGCPIADDIYNLKNCHIAVATPGRLKQLIDGNLFDPDTVRLLVMDEADKLMDVNFQGSINWIYSSFPPVKQMIALSATYPEQLAQHIKTYMRSPLFIRLNVDYTSLLGVCQYYKVLQYHPVPQRQFESKCNSLVELLSAVDFQQCLVFTNFQLRADSLVNQLIASGWPTAFINGSQVQSDRITALSQLKKFKCRVLVSTDLTSRGVDAPNVNLVVNLDVPRDPETYLHRVGRAGRFGAFGAAVSIVCGEYEMCSLERIARQCNVSLMQLPEDVPVDLTSYSNSGYAENYQLNPHQHPLHEQYEHSCLVRSDGSDYHDSSLTASNYSTLMTRMLPSAECKLLESSSFNVEMCHSARCFLPTGIDDILVQAFANDSQTVNVKYFNNVNNALNVEECINISENLVCSQHEHKLKFADCSAYWHDLFTSCNKFLNQKICKLDHPEYTSAGKSFASEVHSKSERTNFSVSNRKCFSHQELFQFQSSSVLPTDDIIQRIKYLQLARRSISPAHEDTATKVNSLRNAEYNEIQNCTGSWQLFDECQDNNLITVNSVSYSSRSEVNFPLKTKHRLYSHSRGGPPCLHTECIYNNECSVCSARWANTFNSRRFSVYPVRNYVGIQTNSALSLHTSHTDDAFLAEYDAHTRWMYYYETQTAIKVYGSMAFY